MSVESLSRALNVPDVTQPERLVLVGIANHDGDGGAWPSIATLARYSCVKERAVQTTISAMVAKGWLRVQVNAGGNRNTRDDRRPNLYEIIWDALPRGAVHDTPSAPRGAIQRADGVQPVAPEPSLEPSTPPTPRRRHRPPEREWRPYDDEPLTPEQQAEKYGVEP